MTVTDSFTIQIAHSLEEIDPHIWDALQQGHPLNPFLTHGFLYALEKSKSAVRETGWMAQHLTLVDDEGKLLAALPCYLKNHSQGEYVFDYGWAEALMRAGGRYYPKLQCSVPFTPVTGERFLCPNNTKAPLLKQALAQGLKHLCERNDISSAHITFMNKQDWDIAGDNDYLQRKDQQFHWLNDDYSCFDSFLNQLSSRKRKNIKKERRQALDCMGLEIEWIKGNQITPQIWDTFFEFYLDTGMRKWGSPYLTREFFDLISQAMPEQILLIMAKRDGEYIAGALNFIGDDALYGRHWGCLEDHAFLHFEVCYYQAIEYAIEHGLDRVEAGAQGSHKLARGYLPVITHSSHWISYPSLRDAVEDFLIHEGRDVEEYAKHLNEHAPFKKKETDDE